MVIYISVSCLELISQCLLACFEIVCYNLICTQGLSLIICRVVILLLSLFFLKITVWDGTLTFFSCSFLCEICFPELFRRGRDSG